MIEAQKCQRRPDRKGAKKLQSNKPNRIWRTDYKKNYRSKDFIKVRKNIKSDDETDTYELAENSSGHPTNYYGLAINKKQTQDKKEYEENFKKA